MQETISEILKNLNITKEELALLVNTSVEVIDNLEKRCCHAPLDPIARRLYALERVADLFQIFLEGEDISSEDMLTILKTSKVKIDIENHEEEETEKYYSLTLIELINLDPINNYWFPLTELAITNYVGEKQVKKEELN